MEKYLSTEAQKIAIEEYQYLIECILCKIGIGYSDYRYEDLFSIGNIGLIKAVLSFSKSKNIKFETYASKCIRNEIYMSFRKSNKDNDNVSLDVSVKDHEGNESLLIDAIEDESSNFEEKILIRQMLNECFGIILNVLSPKERLIMLYNISKKTQQEISKMINISQGYVSKLHKKAIKKVKLYLEQEKQYKQIFSLEIRDNIYKLSMKLKEVEIILRFPPEFESFEIVAQIIEYLEQIYLTENTDKT